MQSIDSLATLLDSASVRHYQRWQILGVYVWPNNFIGQTFAEEVDYLKTWLTARLAWMDANMFGTCDDLIVPEKVYNPLKIFPNPSQDILFVDALEGPANAQLLDQMGKTVGHYSLTQNTNIISTQNFETGIYFLQIEGHPHMYKLMIMHP
jgi:hypothetical protein